MENVHSYQVVFLGQHDRRIDEVKSLLTFRIAELGLDPYAMSFLTEAEIVKRNPRFPTIAIFLGYENANEAAHPAITQYLDESILIVTVVTYIEKVRSEIPERLRHINAIEARLPHFNFDRIVSLVLEGFRLLRRERRLFISYNRKDSQSAANQLYEALDARGFDVFIDTRSVPPAADFQAELWHRLSDSDVVVLIDTPGFRLGRWTTEELARANATNIQILHLLWPGQSEDAASSFSHFQVLSDASFTAPEVAAKFVLLTVDAIEAICRKAEQLRARAIAARHRYLVDSFCDAARAGGLLPIVQPQRWISVKLKSGKELAIVPTIGIPTSDRIHQVFDAIADSASDGAGTWILYDSRGMLSSWQKHLSWLDSYLPTKSMSMGEVEKIIEELLK